MSRDEVFDALNHRVAAILCVMNEPLWNLLHQLEDEGRVSSDEMAALRTELKDRRNRFPELIRQQLTHE